MHLFLSLLNLPVLKPFSLFCDNQAMISLLSSESISEVFTVPPHSRWNPGGIHIISMWIPSIPYGIVWLRAQPFWRMIPYSFHMETPWNLNIPWNISLESRWNEHGIHHNSFHGFHIILNGFHVIPHYSTWIPYYSRWIPHYFTWIPHYSRWIPQYFTWIPHYSIWIPYYSTLFHMDSTLFQMDSILFYIYSIL